MAEELVLPAKVTDGFTKPLKELAERLKNLRPGPALQATQKHFVDLKRQVEAVGNAMKGMGNGLAGGLGLPGLSLGALSAAGAMAALGASVQSFAKTTIDMKNFTAATGIASTKLKELKAVAAGLGVSEDAIQGALGFSAQNADAMRRHQGNYSALANLGPGGQSIANDLAGTKSNDEVLEKQFRYLQQQKSAAQRRTLAGLFFGDEGMAAFGNESSAAFMKRRAAARASIGGQSGQDEKNAEAFLDATSKVSAAFEKLKNSVGGALAPGMTEMAEAINKFSIEHTGDVKQFFVDLGKQIQEHDWKRDSDDINTALGVLKSFFESLNKFKENLDAIAQGIHDRAVGLMPGNITPQTGAELGKKLEKATEGKDLSPDANRGLRDTMMDDGNVHKMAYSPGARAGAMGIISASQSATVAILALGVQKGMEAFYQGLQSGGPEGSAGGGSGGGGGGFINASYQPGGGARAALGGMRAARSAAGVHQKYKDSDFAVPDGTPGQYRPAYKLSDADLSDDVVNIINGEATSSKLSTDAVINNMFNRLGTKAYGPSSDLRKVATAPGQYAGKARASASRAAFIRARIRAIASGAVPDVTNGSNEYRAGWYNGPCGRKHADSPVIGGNRFAYNPKVAPGPYAPYRKSASEAASQKAAEAAAKAGATGKVDVHVHSKDTPATVKSDNGPALGEVKMNRGKSVPLTDI